MDKLPDHVLTYAPRLFLDEAEPFPLIGIGATLFHSSAMSPSFPREIILPDQASMAIEYAFYWDYDIEHLYDLEHIWVYIGRDGRVIDAEASFHGRYFKALLPFVQPALEDTHLNIYCQPGKHAFLPKGEWFQLLPDLKRSCRENAGSGGLLVNDLFRQSFSTDDDINAAVEEYIKTRFAFTPTLRFAPVQPDKSLYMAWDELRELIPGCIKAQLDLILHQ